MELETKGIMKSKCKMSKRNIFKVKLIKVYILNDEFYSSSQGNFI